MLGRKQKADLSIVPATAPNALKVGVAGWTGLVGELLIAAGPLKFAGLAILNVNTVQVVLVLPRNQNRNSH